MSIQMNQALMLVLHFLISFTDINIAFNYVVKLYKHYHEALETYGGNEDEDKKDFIKKYVCFYMVLLKKTISMFIYKII